MRTAFLDFLESEYSAENLCFWLSCEKFRKLKTEEQRFKEGQSIYSRFISPNSPLQVTDFECSLTIQASARSLLLTNACAIQSRASGVLRLFLTIRCCDGANKVMLLNFPDAEFAINKCSHSQ